MTETTPPTEPARQTFVERLPVPEGTIPVGIALLIAGIATYAFFIIGNSAVGGDKEFAPITQLWFATFALAPGFFLPLEQDSDGPSPTVEHSVRAPDPWFARSSSWGSASRSPSSP